VEFDIQRLILESEVQSADAMRMRGMLAMDRRIVGATARRY
jgi:hypothetical protein